MVFAGSTLIAAMVVALLIVPGALLASLAATVILVVFLSVGVAVVAGPAVLTLLGSNVNRWRIGKAQSFEDESSGLMAIVNAALRRPVTVCLIVGAVVLALCAPMIGLKTGPPSAEQLSHTNQERQDAELINRAIAPGFDAPFVVIAEAEDGPITSPERLEALRRWQDAVAEMPGVQVVIGPEEVAKSVAPLQEAGKSLIAEDGGPVNSLANLGRNLDKAAKGVVRLRGGISEASAGAGLLAEGSDNAEEGAGQLASGLAEATAGSKEAVDALGQFAEGSKELAEGQERAAEGGEQNKVQLRDLAANMKANGLRVSRKLQKNVVRDAHTTTPALQNQAGTVGAEASVALQQLEAMTTGQADPNYAAALASTRKRSKPPMR